jgi:hypothetical protein
MPTISHLENLLNIWEDLCFIYRLGAKMRQGVGMPLKHPLEGPIKHSAEFRDYLLTIRPGTRIDERFMPSGDALRDVCPVINECPLLLASWTGASRRVYRPDRDLQVLLQATSLEGVTFDDVPWPFQSFAMALERPLIDHNGQSHSLLIVNIMFDYRDQEKPAAIAVAALSDSLLQYRPNPGRLVERALKRLRQKDWRRCEDVKEGLTEDFIGRLRPLGSLGHLYCIAWEKVAEMDVSGPMTGLTPNPESEGSMIREATRLAAGLCLYLAARAPHGHDPESAPWEPLPKAPGAGRAVTDGAEVCDVASVHRLSSAEIAAIDDPSFRTAGAISAHFRSGHWRRPPGKGDDPTAPKTVWVRPTLVCRDRLPEVGVPVGATSHITS